MTSEQAFDRMSECNTQADDFKRNVEPNVIKAAVSAEHWEKPLIGVATKILGLRRGIHTHFPLTVYASFPQRMRDIEKELLPLVTATGIVFWDTLHPTP